MKSIKVKIIFYFSLLIILVAIIFTLTSVYNLSNIVIEEGQKALLENAISSSEIIAERNETNYIYLEGVSLRENIYSTDVSVDHKMNLLLDEVERTDRFLRIGVSDLDGNLFLSDSYGIGGDIVDINTRDYYHENLEGNRGIMNPTISVNPDDDGAPVMVYSLPLIENNNIVGSIVAVANAWFLNDLIDDMGFGEKGYAYIVDDFGNTIAHPNRDNIINQVNIIEMGSIDEDFKDLSITMENLLEKPSGYGHYELNGEKLMMGMSEIPNTNWNIVIVANESEVLASLPIVKNRLILISLITLMISIIICLIIGSRISNNILKAIDYSKHLVELDFTKEVPKDLIKRDDELGLLANSFQVINDSIKKVIKNIQEHSENVAASSEELKATTDQSVEASNEISNAINDISSGAYDQAKDTERGMQDLMKLSEYIEGDVLKNETLGISTEQVINLKNEGFEILLKLVEGTKETKLSTKDIQSVVITTNESAEKIEKASEMISTIAEQTNLLALNAAIEAARAGEAGKGFAVVAEEIRKLAEQSNNFTEEINKVISELSDKTNKAVKTIELVERVVSDQEVYAEETQEKFNGISKAMEEMKKSIQEVNESSNIIQKQKDEVMNVMQNLASISEENAASSEQSAASVEEQNAGMIEIAKTSENLAKLAEEMAFDSKKFKI